MQISISEISVSAPSVFAMNAARLRFDIKRLLPNEKGWHVSTLLNLSAIKKYKWGTKCLVKAYHFKTSAKLMKVSSSFIFELFSLKKGCLFVYFMLL